MTPAKLPLTGDPDADRLLEDDPLALLIGMLLDQQVTMEKAFHSPYELKERLGGHLDASEIAAMDPDELRAVVAERPALHRFPASMAVRTLDLAKALVEHYDGRAEPVWDTAKDGNELLANLKALPGFGDQKAKIFTALLGKRMGVAPPGWQEAAGFYGDAGCYSAADVDGAESLAKVREYKRAAKAEAKAKAKAKATAAKP
ncbi:MAG: Fe-S cluster assembly protein HesB [Chloroflexi bacterium]|nr:MAG: Fe-S cluster assembly protein HesB [Chloroflexota bacterium]